MINKIDFGDGVKRKYIDLSFDENTVLSDIVDDLKEDLVQIEYINGYLIDVGWYPEFDIKGRFKVRLIKNYDWDNGLYCSECETLEAMLSNLHKCIRMINEKVFE